MRVEMMRLFAISLLVMTLFSCTKEYGYDVNSEVEPYFRLFETEAAERGYVFNLEADGIGATVDFIKDGTTVGQCQTSDQGNKRVFIDRAFWESFDHYEREFIVFHELGHCVLDRDHDDSVSSMNKCASIMQSGLGRCKNDYGPDTREEYLDELFNF